jgi:hypothetical protein
VPFVLFACRIAARTLWPVKVNRKCQFYRDQRLGIDLVTDDTEIELCKEEEVLTNVVGANTSSVRRNHGLALF